MDFARALRRSGHIFGKCIAKMVLVALSAQPPGVINCVCVCVYPEYDVPSLASVAHSCPLFSPRPRVILTLVLLLRGPSLRRAMAATDHPLAGSYQGRHSEFVQSFVTKRPQKKKRPRILSAEERADHRKALSKIQQLQPAFAEETQINTTGALRRWAAQVHEVAHCWVVLTGHEGTANSTSFPASWRDVIKQEIDRPMLQDHLDWMCNILNIKSEGTSWEYWRQFKQLYNLVNGRHVDTNDNREVKKVLQLHRPGASTWLIA